MLLAAYGFMAQQVGVLLACTFLMGCHSTLFGPAKFAYLPEVLQERELQELRASGCSAHWTDNFETARNLILKFAVSV
jgi:hypothetical protein